MSNEHILQIVKAVEPVEGVISVHVVVNSDFYRDFDKALPPLSIRITVKGGKKKEIASTIWTYKPMGFVTVGNKKVKIKDSQDYEHDVYFERIE